MNDRRFKKRLAVDLPIELHDHIRQIARKRRCTISSWVIERLHTLVNVETVMSMRLWDDNEKNTKKDL